MKLHFDKPIVVVRDRNSIVLNNNYVPINDPPQTLEEALSVFVGEVNNAATRARIQFTLDRWNMIHGTDVTMNDLDLF